MNIVEGEFYDGGLPTPFFLERQLTELKYGRSWRRNMPFRLSELTRYHKIDLKERSIFTDFIPKNHRFVYFLFDFGIIVYIGQSIDIYTRLKQHINQRKIVFDMFSFIPLRDNEDLNECEKEYIKTLSPKYNVKHNTGNYSPAHFIPRKNRMEREKISLKGQ